MTRTAPARRRHARLIATALLLLPIPHPAFAQGVILPEGMAIRLQTRQDVSSKTAHVGDEVDLAVAKAVTIGGMPVIPAGSPAVGRVVGASDNGLLGRSGKLDIEVNMIRAGQIEIPVRGGRDAKGQPGTLGAVGAGVVFLPLAILIRGKDVKLPAGTTFDVYVDKEVTVPSAAVSLTPQETAPLAPEPPPSVIRSIDPNDALKGG